MSAMSVSARRSDLYCVPHSLTDACSQVDTARTSILLAATWTRDRPTSEFFFPAFAVVTHARAGKVGSVYARMNVFVLLPRLFWLTLGALGFRSVSCMSR